MLCLKPLQLRGIAHHEASFRVGDGQIHAIDAAQNTQCCGSATR